MKEELNNNNGQNTVVSNDNSIKKIVINAGDAVTETFLIKDEICEDLEKYQSLSTKDKNDITKEYTHVTTFIKQITLAINRLEIDKFKDSISNGHLTTFVDICNKLYNDFYNAIDEKNIYKIGILTRELANHYMNLINSIKNNNERKHYIISLDKDIKIRKFSNGFKKIIKLHLSQIRGENQVNHTMNCINEMENNYYKDINKIKESQYIEYKHKNTDLFDLLIIALKDKKVFEDINYKSKF